MLPTTVVVLLASGSTASCHNNPECACDWVRCDFQHIYVTGYGMWVPSSGSEVNTSVGISHIPKGHVPVGKVVGMIIQGTHHRLPVLKQEKHFCSCFTKLDLRCSEGEGRSSLIRAVQL